MSTSRPGRWALIGCAAALVAASAGCQTIECAEGTIEKNDECVPASGASPEADSCGPGTEYSASDGACIPVLPPTQCGPNTVEEVGEDGVVVCVGVGGGSCDQPIACSQPDATFTTICGQIFDIEDGTPVQDGDGSDTTACVVDDPAETGPCSLELFAYDAIQFANDPEDAQPLAADELTIDRCGRFRVVNARVPTAGIIALALQDNSNGTVDEVALSGIAARVSPGLRVADRELYSVRNDTDAAWTSSAGDPFGATSFAEKGVAAVIFRHAGDPVPGVVATLGGDAQPADDYYFESAETTLSTIDPAADETGDNGAGLLVNISGVVTLSGMGAEPGGCEWASELAASPAGAVFVTSRVPVDETNGEECP